MKIYSTACALLLLGDHAASQPFMEPIFDYEIIDGAGVGVVALGNFVYIASNEEYSHDADGVAGSAQNSWLSKLHINGALESRVQVGSNGTLLSTLTPLSTTSFVTNIPFSSPSSPPEGIRAFDEELSQLWINNEIEERGEIICPLLVGQESGNIVFSSAPGGTGGGVAVLTATGELLWKDLSIKKPGSCSALSPDENTLYVVDNTKSALSSHIVAFDPETGSQTGNNSEGVASSNGGPGISADGNSVYVSDIYGLVRFAANLSSFVNLLPISGGSSQGRYSPLVSPDNDVVYVFPLGSDGIEAYDVTGDEASLKWSFSEKSVSRAAPYLTRDGTQLLFFDKRGLGVIRASEGYVEMRYSLPSDYFLRQLFVNEDETRVYVAYTTGVNSSVVSLNLRGTIPPTASPVLSPAPTAAPTSEPTATPSAGNCVTAWYMSKMAALLAVAVVFGLN